MDDNTLNLKNTDVRLSKAQVTTAITVCCNIDLHPSSG